VPRLFTTLWPTRTVLDELVVALLAAERWPPPGWRAIPTDRWHLTLCFHGDADPEPLARHLAARIAGLRPPLLRLGGAVGFPSVLAAGVEAASATDTEALTALVAAAGGDPGRFRAHVTVARARRREATSPPPVQVLREYRGSWWLPDAVCLVRSEEVLGARRYTVVHRESLA
jgi:2'-5' RNA ligase